MANTPQNMIFWNTLGYQSEVKTEVRKRTPPKRTLWGSIGCLGSPMMIFGSPLGSPFWRRNDTWRPADRLQGPSWFHYIDSASTKWHLASCWQAWSPLLSPPQVHSDVGSHLWNRSLSVVLKNVRAVSLSLSLSARAQQLAVQIRNLESESGYCILDKVARRRVWKLHQVSAISRPRRLLFISNRVQGPIKLLTIHSYVSRRKSF